MKFNFLEDITFPSCHMELWKKNYGPHINTIEDQNKSLTIRHAKYLSLDNEEQKQSPSKIKTVRF